MNIESEARWDVLSVETHDWKATVGVPEDNVDMKITLQGEFDLTWADKGDMVLTCGYYESLDLPRLLRMLAVAVDEVRSESPYET